MVEAWDFRIHFEQPDNKRCLSLMENIHRLMRFEAEWLGRVSRLFFCFERQIQEALSILLVKAFSGSACNYVRDQITFSQGASILRNR